MRKVTAKDVRRAHATSKAIWKIWTLFVVAGLLVLAFMLGYFPVMFGAKIVETELDHFGRAVNRIDTAYQSARDGVKYFGKAVKNVAENESSIKRGSLIKAENGYVVIDDNGDAHFYKKASSADAK